MPTVAEFAAAKEAADLNGLAIPVTANGSPATGTPLSVTGFAPLTPERKRRNQALKQATECYDCGTDLSDKAVWLIAVPGVCVLTGRHFDRLWGFCFTCAQGRRRKRIRHAHCSNCGRLVIWASVCRI